MSALYKKTIFYLGLFLLLFFVEGCDLIIREAINNADRKATDQKFQDALSKNSDVPVYSFNQEIPYAFKENLFAEATNLKIKINEAYWSDSYESSSLPKNADFKIKPEEKFLIIKISIYNPEKKPIAVPQQSLVPILFHLYNEQGIEYNNTSNPNLSGENIYTKMRTKYINPGMELKGELVYDIPNANYILIVSRGLDTILGKLNVLPPKGPIKNSSATTNKK